jgi:membrane protease YdiL (CAAX protease family)
MDIYSSVLKNRPAPARNMQACPSTLSYIFAYGMLYALSYNKTRRGLLVVVEAKSEPLYY